MKPQHALYLIAVVVLLAACDTGRNSDKNSTAGTSPTKLMQNQRNALEKAKGVENNVQQQAQEQQRDADQQTQ